MACRSTRTCQNRQPRLSIGGRSATRTTAVTTTTTPKRPGGAGQAHTTRDGRALEAQVPTAVPRSCVSRRSPAAACRLARTERNTQEGLVNDANRVYGRSGWWSAFRGAQRPSWFRCLHCSDFERRRRTKQAEMHHKPEKSLSGPCFFRR